MYGFCPKTPLPPSCQNFAEFGHNQELMQMTKTFLPFNNKIVSQFSKRRLCKAKQTYCDENVGNFEEDKREREGETRLKTVETEGCLRKDQDGQLCLTLGLGRCSGCQCSVTTKKLDPTLDLFPQFHKTLLMNILGYLIGREDLCPKDILVNYESTVSPPYLCRPIHAIFLSQPFENNFISRGTHFSL